MSKSQSLKLFLLGMLLPFILQENPVFAESLTTSPYVGVYTQRDVDSQSQLFLMDDHSFCFTFTSGSLDLIKAG